MSARHGPRMAGGGALAAFSVTLLALLPAAAPVAALQVTTFSDGASIHNITIPGGGGSDTATSVVVPKDSYAVSAQLSVRARPDSAGRYPFGVQVGAMVGSNNSLIYQYGGQGYGAMGRQTVFAAGNDTASVSCQASCSLARSTLLPKGAVVTSASLSITGEKLDLGFLGPDFLTHVNNAGNNVQINTSARGSPYLVDVDGDGDLDLFAGGGNFSVWTDPFAGGPRFYRNTGNATSWQFKEEPAVLRGVAKGYGYAPALADLNGDGLLDLITVGGPYGGLSYAVRFYWNTGSASSPTWTANNTTFSGIQTDGIAHAAFADLDGDGDLDLTIGDGSGALTYYENTGTMYDPVWSAKNIYSGLNVGSNAAPAFADYDSDGDLDLAIGNGSGSIFGSGGGPTTIRLWDNQGNASSPSFVLVSTFDSMDVGPTYTDTDVAPFLADLDADGDMDMVVADASGNYWYYTGRLSTPSAVSIQLGSVGTLWNQSGPLLGKASISGLASKFNDNMNLTPAPSPDGYGNRMVANGLTLSTSTGGTLTLGDLSLVYDYAAPSKDFAGPLNTVRASLTPDSQGNVAMSISVAARSAGIVSVESPLIVLDLPPSFTDPGVLTILEDTKVDNVLDLTTAFADDFTSGPDLTFRVDANSAAGAIDAYISSGRYLGIDAATGGANDNWNGWLNVTVTAVDGRGLQKSGVLLVHVLPVNDAPEIFGIDPYYTILEDKPWELIPRGHDVDGDPLVWSILGKPAGASFDTGSGALRWTPLNADVGNHSMSVYLSDGAVTVQVNFFVYVQNVNDAPFLLQVPDQIVLETQTLTIDLSAYFGDEDDPPYTLTVIATSPHTTQKGNILSIYLPKNSGVSLEVVNLTVTDPHGAVAHGRFLVTVIPAGPDLALIGVPDLQVVETVPKTIDLAPYLYNVKNWANVSVSASSAQASVSGTKVTFLYPKGYASNSEGVSFTAKEGDQSSSWKITVTIIRLGSAILIADLPDIDVGADEEMVIELAPYIHNVMRWAGVTITEDSSYAWVEGTSLHLQYPFSAGLTGEVVSVTVTEGANSSTDAMGVRIHSTAGSFTLDPLPPITVVEGQPFVLFVSSYVKNADSLANVKLSVASPYAAVDGLTVTFLYPVGSGVANEQVTVVARDGAQSFSTVISVTVVSLGQKFTIAGVPNVQVYAGAPYNLSLVPYLYNVPGGDFSKVVVTITSSYVTVGPGPKLTFLYPKGTTLTRESVTITASVRPDTASQAITVSIKPLSSRLTFASVPELRLTEDEPFALDLLPYIYNVKPNVELVVLTESAYASVSNVTLLTITYPGGIPADEFVVTVQVGTEFAQGTVRVIVLQRDDPPRLLQALTNFTAAPGVTVTWDLTQFFTDEEHPELLRFTASDARVVIDNDAKTARLVAPASGSITFTITAIDGEDANLTATSPSASVTAVAGGPGAGKGLVATGDERAWWMLLPVFLVLALLVALAHRLTRGASWGASADSSFFLRRR